MDDSDFGNMSESAMLDSMFTSSMSIPKLNMPSLLIWGKQDQVTPPRVAEEFHSLLPNSELHWIDLCGHAPMWEHPKKFSEIVLKWMNKHISS